MTSPRATPSRSIPACAGEPWVSLRLYGISGVYPRVCGGTINFERPDGSFYGLSPRVRGNRITHHTRRHIPRSIPACAGEPYHTPHSTTHPQVYPRVCGGTAYCRVSRAWVTGLSPRVRGNRVLSGESSLGHRSIPACAGEPRTVG